jgi:hypothetical protein
LSIADELFPGYGEPEPARRTRVSHPKGFAPGYALNVETGLLKEATVSSDAEIAVADIESHRKKIEEQTGLKVPANLDVRLERLTLQSTAEGGERWWYKYVFLPRLGVDEDGNAIDYTQELSKLRAKRSPYTNKFESGDAVLGVVWSDWQLFKKEGGGIVATMDSIDRAFSNTVERLQELRKLNRGVSRMVIFGNGDMVEGCNIFDNHAWQLEGDSRDQMNAFVDLGLEGIDRFAEWVDEIVVVAAGGNHGENRENGRKINNHDNADVEGFEHIRRVTDRDPKLSGKVKYRLAHSSLVNTVDINGHIYAITHGQVFGKSQAGSIEQKAYKFYCQQAGGKLPAGDADVLITSHFHHRQSADWGGCLWQQSGTMDGGSQHFTETSGKWSERSMLTFVSTPQNKWQDEQNLI